MSLPVTAYAIVAAPWLVLGYLLPWQFLACCLVAGAAGLGAAAWLAGGRR